MTLAEAISSINTRSSNINLQWFILKWNDGYCVVSASYIKRFPNTKFIFAGSKNGEKPTEFLNLVWSLEYDRKEDRFKHVVNTL